MNKLGFEVINSRHTFIFNKENGRNVISANTIESFKRRLPKFMYGDDTCC